MCGLLGFIGDSKSPEFTKQLTTSLFIRTQSRGIDASGFYCAGDFDSKNIFYHKSPVPSSTFINQTEYKSIWKSKLNMGMFHCRAASMGVGSPAMNQNNHPFVSTSNTKAVIHNGLIPKTEYDFFRNYYDVQTSCDSEMFLRILEQSGTFFENYENFLAYNNNSHYAVCYGQIDEETRDLYLFRNQFRPLFIADLIDKLGQIYFFSTYEIFTAALEDIRLNLDNAKIYELEPNRVIHISFNRNKEFSIEEYSVEKFKTTQPKYLYHYPIMKETSEYQNQIIPKQENAAEITQNFLEKYFEQSKIMEQELLSYLQRDKVDNLVVAKIFNFIRDLQKKQDVYKKLLEGT